MQAWVVEELASVDLPDERLEARYRVLLDTLSRKPSASIPAACGAWEETLAAYRFLDNERVEAAGILRPHQDATRERIRREQVVLVAQDTTELDLTRPKQQVVGAGPLNDVSRVGFFAHVLLAMTPERVPLGVVHSEVWARDAEEFHANQQDKAAKEKKKKQKALQEKESYRWLEGYRHGCRLAREAPETTVVVISDSEGDVFECFLEGQQAQEAQTQAAEAGPQAEWPQAEWPQAEWPRAEWPRAEWIVRACQNRNLPVRESPGQWAKLWSAVESAPVQGTLEVEVSQNRAQGGGSRRRKQARSARRTTVTVQALSVRLRGPLRPGGRLPETTVNAVLVREIAPPPGEAPIEWLLLTSLPIATWEQICLVIAWYCCRWQIEIYFRVLKGGCRVEERHLETAERYLACLALYQVIAWRVLYVLMLGRECPEMDCSEVFAEEEWKAVYAVVHQAPPPEKPPTLGEMVRLIARLGGYLGRKHDGPPGPKTLWLGLQRMSDLALAWRTFGPDPPRKRKRYV